MRIRSCIACLLFLAAASGVFADENPVSTSQYFGVGAGIGTGLGLSYRSWEGAVGWQITALPNYSTAYQLYSLGVSGLVTLNDARWSRFFAYGGGAVMGGGYFGTVEWNIQAGVGIGMEFVLFDHLAIDLQAGLGSMMPLPMDVSYYLGPVGSVALYYRM